MKKIIARNRDLVALESRVSTVEGVNNTLVPTIAAAIAVGVTALACSLSANSKVKRLATDVVKVEDDLDDLYEATTNTPSQGVQ